AHDALSSEEKRHTGAGGFVWSSAVEDDFAIVRQQIVFLLQFLGVHAEGARECFRVGFEIHGMAKIDDDEILASVELFLQFLDGDARDAQFAHEALARYEFVANVACERPDQDDPEPAAERGGAFRDAFNLAAENVTDA